MDQTIPTSQDEANTQKVVLAGMRVMYDPKVFPQFFSAFSHGGPLPDTLAAQAVGLIKILDGQAKGQIPRNILATSAVVLMLEMADCLVKAGVAKPTKEDLQAATQKLTALLLRVYGAQPAAQGTPQSAPQGAPTTPPPGGLIQGAMQ